jgi:hypothetical protein
MIAATNPALGVYVPDDVKTWTLGPVATWMKSLNKKSEASGAGRSKVS